ncbi:MAG: Ig-like domain-containing protein, partial [Tannerella sp.]|nr:Ig-like domain-containing protein [Tannerella sp.]
MKNYLILSVVLTAMLSSCVVENVKVQPLYVDSVFISNKIGDIIVGDTTTLNAAYSPFDADVLPEFTWQSSDSEIATIDQKGLLEAVGDGEVTITLKAVAPQQKGSIELSDAMDIIVHPIAITGIQLSTHELKVLRGDPNVTLTYKIIPDDAKPKEIVWSSNNPNVATVNDGVVTFVNVGNAVITVAVAGNSSIRDVCNVTVSPVTLTNMYFDPTTYQLEQGFNVNVAANLIMLPENADNKNVTYRSSNSSIASVNALGVVTGVSSGVEPGKGPGKATITATSLAGGRTATCTVEVYSPVDLVSVSVEILNMVVAEGLSGTIVPSLHNNSSKPVTM